MDKGWKIACTIVYLLICILDFIIIPSYILHKSETLISYEYYQKVHEIFEDDPESARIIISERKPGQWTPFTLRGGGVFHISFGAILTGSIIGKKKE